MAKRIGWIGTGVMGKSMCSHILKENDAVFILHSPQSGPGSHD